MVFSCMNTNFTMPHHSDGLPITDCWALEAATLVRGEGGWAALLKVLRAGEYGNMIQAQGRHKGTKVRRGQ